MTFIDDKLHLNHGTKKTSLKINYSSNLTSPIKLIQKLIPLKKTIEFYIECK